jgi:hypothetical protein
MDVDAIVDDHESCGMRKSFLNASHELGDAHLEGRAATQESPRCRDGDAMARRA